MQESDCVKELCVFSENASLDSTDIDFVFFARIVAAFIQIDKKVVLSEVLKCIASGGGGLAVARIGAEEVLAVTRAMKHCNVLLRDTTHAKRDVCMLRAELRGRALSLWSGVGL
eukprot:3643821-Rhodomonas_salina.1